MTENETIQSMAESLLKGVPVVMVILALALAVLVRYRTRSGHAVLRWLWRRIAGKAESKDTAFNKFIDAQDTLMQFRFVSGDARTVAQMHSVINWGLTHNEHIGDMNACGPYFDREKPGLKDLGRWRPEWLVWPLAISWGLLAVGIFLIALITLGGKAIVQVKETNNWLVLDMHSANSLMRPGTQRLFRENCAQPVEINVKNSGFSEKDVIAICEAYSNPEKTLKFIEAGIQESQLALAPTGALFVILFVMNHRLIYCTKAAVAMKKRLNRPRP